MQRMLCLCAGCPCKAIKVENSGRSNARSMYQLWSVYPYMFHRSQTGRKRYQSCQELIAERFNIIALLSPSFPVALPDVTPDSLSVL